MLRTDGDLSSPVQWRNAQGQRAAVRSLVGSRTAASCHMPKQRKREAKERRRVWLRCFVPAFFLPATTLPFDPFVLLISLPPWIEEGKKPSESVHTPIGRTDRLRCWSARFSVIVARTGGERWAEDGERVRTCTARPAGQKGPAPRRESLYRSPVVVTSEPIRGPPLSVPSHLLSFPMARR